MKKLILISAILVLIGRAYAQEIKLSGATEQHWSGGECCSHGVKYVIVIESTDTINILKFDTVWIENKYYIPETQAIPGYSMWKMSGKMTYHVSVSESWNDKNKDTPNIKEEKPTKVPPKYKGQGCLIYQTQNQKKLMEIESFKELAPIAYP